MADDQELVRQLRLGKEDAYQAFGLRFGPIAEWYFASRGIRRDEAQDLAASWVHDTLLKIDKYQNLEDASFSAWVFKLMHNAAADWWRSRRHIQFEPLSDRIITAGGQDDWSTNGESIEKACAVHEALSELSEKERQVVDLRLAGCSFAEIGDVVAATEVSARVLYHRALKKLHKLLEVDPRIVSRKIPA